MQAVNWKAPIAVWSVYAISCLIYESFFNVPGNISVGALSVFMMPYLGSSLALYLNSKRKLFFDFQANSNTNNSTGFLDKVVTFLVPLILVLQVISWIYIFYHVDVTGNSKEFFMSLRNYSINMTSVVPTFLSYPNGICFAAFCIAFASYRCKKKNRQLFLLSISILNIFLNDLQTSGRAGMAFVVFVLFSSTCWDWRVNRINPSGFLLSIFSITIFTQLPKVLREGYGSIFELGDLIQEVMRYCFSYLNTLTELLMRLPDPNWIGQRSFLPIYNILSRFDSSITRQAIHSVENSNVWGYNNYTIAGELIRDFSYIGCFIIPFFITLFIIYFASISSVPLNIAITSYFYGWLIYGSITNILMMGGFLISLVCLFALSCIEVHYSVSNK